MTHTLWDLVPHITLHQDPSGAHHTQDELCPRARKTKERSLRDVLKEEVEEGETTLMCREYHCAQDLTEREVWMLAETLRTLKGVEEARDKEDVLDLLVNCSRALGRTTRQRSHVESAMHQSKTVRDAHLQILEELKGLADEMVELLKEPYWTKRLRTALQEQAPSDEEVGLLQDAGLGGPGDMGLLVGPRNLYHDSSTKGLLMNILAEPGTGTNAYVIAPLGVTRWILSNLSGRTKGYLGHPAQVTDLPEGLTPETLEIILGLFNPFDPGHMGRLPDVIKAALALSEDT